MSTARQRQAQEELAKCGDKLNLIGTHIVEGCASHHDEADLIVVIHKLAEMLPYITRLDVYRDMCSGKTDKGEHELPGTVQG